MVGLKLDAARKRIQDAGFRVADQPTPVNSYSAKGAVVGTTPKGKTIPGSIITINTSNGIAPAPVYRPPVQDTGPVDAPPPFQTAWGPDTFVVIEKWESMDALKAHAKLRKDELAAKVATLFEGSGHLPEILVTPVAAGSLALTEQGLSMIEQPAVAAE